jgi:hypothetical protein
MKKNLTLSQWLIEKTDGEAYRAGKLSGESSEKSSEKAYVTKHPKVDQQIINQIGSLTKLISQAREMEKMRSLADSYGLTGGTWEMISVRYIIL